MNAVRLTTRLVMASGILLASAVPAAAFALSRPLEVQVGYERGIGAEAYDSQALTADQPQIERLFTRLTAALEPDWGAWLDIGRGAYEFADQDFPGTTHRRQETRLAVGVARHGEFAEAAWTLGAGYGLSLLQVQSSARLTDPDPAFFFVPWQALHGVSLSESLRLGVGPVGMAIDADWFPFLFAHLADGRLGLPAYLTSFRLAPRLTFWDDRISLGYAFERTLGDGFHRQADGPFAAITWTGF